LPEENAHEKREGDKKKKNPLMGTATMKGEVEKKKRRGSENTTGHKRMGVIVSS